MAQTIKEGLRGNVLGTYAYCAGAKETRRRADQIERGLLGPVWAGPKKTVKKRTVRKKTGE